MYSCNVSHAGAGRGSAPPPIGALCLPHRQAAGPVLLVGSRCAYLAGAWGGSATPRLLGLTCWWVAGPATLQARGEGAHLFVFRQLREMEDVMLGMKVGGKGKVSALEKKEGEGDR